MARKFLYIIAGLIVFALTAALAYRLFGAQFVRWTQVPRTPFTN